MEENCEKAEMDRTMYGYNGRKNSKEIREKTQSYMK